MEINKIIDQFSTFYGTSVAPHDLLLLSAQVPEVLEIINILIQFHSQQMQKNIPYSALAPVLSTEFAEFPAELQEVFRIIRQLFAES